MFLGLCAFVLHVQIGAFEVDAQDLGTFIALFHHLGHIGYSLGQNVLALGDGGGQESGNTLAHDVLGPIAQTGFLGVVGVKLVGAVAVHIDHAGDDALVSVISIHGLCTVGTDADDFAAVHFHLSGHKLVGDPNFLTLNDHGNTSNYIYRLTDAAIRR